jgi:HK97 family phage major capsid protein
MRAMDEKALKELKAKWGKLPVAEQRQKMLELVTEQRSMYEKAASEKRELTGDETTTYEAMDADVEALHANLHDAEHTAAEAEKRAKSLESREAFLAQPQRVPLKLDVDGGKGGEKAVVAPEAWRKRYDPDVISRYEARAKPGYAKAFGAYLTALDARYELAPQEFRDLSVGTASQGGYAVPVQEFVPQIIRKLDDLFPLIAKATKFEVPQAQSLGVPTLEANPSDSTWTTEVATGGQDVTMAFGKRELTPWPIAKLLLISRKLMRASPLNMEALIRDRMAYKIGNPVSNALNQGTGANQPLGIFVASSAGITTGRDTAVISTGALDPDKVITLRHSIRDAYKNLTWVMHRTTFAKFRSLKATTGQYLWLPSMGLVDVPSTLLDFPYVLDETAPAWTATASNYLMVLGDLSYIWMAIALNFDIQRLDELYAATNQVGFIVRAEIDAMPTLEDAFVRGITS